MIAALPAWVLAAPAAFALGLVLGVWVGARYLIVRRRRDA